MRILLVHLQFELFGGAEMYCLRVADLLQRDRNDIVILHMGRAPDFDWVNRRCGIVLDRARVRFQALPMPGWLRWLSGSSVQRLLLLKYAFVVRQARRLVRGFDLTISTFAECPLPTDRVLQSVHMPLLVWDRESLKYWGLNATRAMTLKRIFYLVIVYFFMGAGRGGIARQRTVTNSEWTKDQYLRVYTAGTARAIHSGVRVALTPHSPDWIPFEQRQNNLIMIGRLAPAKRIEQAIAIVEGLRARGHDVGLKILGEGEGAYAASIAQAAESRPWMQWLRGVSREEMERIAVHQKWGLHCYHFEHYGLAPAELQASGCITFIHDSGGQREIVLHPGQRYCDVVDAVNKIDAVMRSQALQHEMLACAEGSIAQHTIERFEAGLTDAITWTVAGRAPSVQT
jgi:glycosyltransferase involved in cell wall biosynthesis